MKTIYYFIFILILTLQGCGGGGSSDNASTNKGTTYEYDSIGRLAKLSDKSGRILTYSYDPAGNLLSVNVIK
jgi:YD repeat-containing protein